MQRTIVALDGDQNTGKTTTIKRVHYLLITKFKIVKVENIDLSLRVEVRAIITINGKRIGIVSKGDKPDYVRESIELFTKRRCHLIICATRTNKKTHKIVNSHEPQYVVKWSTKEETKDEAKREKADNEVANKFFDIAKKLINS